MQNLTYTLLKFDQIITESWILDTNYKSDLIICIQAYNLDMYMIHMPVGHQSDGIHFWLCKDDNSVLQAKVPDLKIWFQGRGQGLIKRVQ